LGLAEKEEEMSDIPEWAYDRAEELREGVVCTEPRDFGYPKEPKT